MDSPARLFSVGSSRKRRRRPTHQRFQRIPFKLEMFVFPDDLMQYCIEKRYAFGPW
jgi:hypothetical protein